MENRFSAKDFVLIGLMAAVIVLVVVSMFQFDRQWDNVQLIREKLDDQARDLRALREQIGQGVAIRGDGGATTQAAGGDDPFVRLRDVEKMPSFARGDWIINGLAAKSATLTPLVSGDVYAAQVQALVLEPLGQRDPQTLEWTGRLATSWKVEDHVAEYQKFVEANPASTRPVAEGTTRPADREPPHPVVIAFKMRPGVRFSDGEPLTADDVVWTFDYTMNPAVNAPRDRAYLSKIAKVVKTAPDEVTFYFREPYFDALGLAASFQVLPKHFYSKFTTAEFNASTGLLMGSGPYRLESPTSWKPSDPMEVLRNERYWGVAPPVDRLVWRVIDNDVARLTAFRNGEVDTYDAPPEAYVKLKDDPKLAEKANRFEYFAPGGGYRFVAWNELKAGKPTHFADKRVRRALALLIDRQRLLKEITFGYSELATGPFSPLGKQYDKSVQPIPYDFDGGKRLLAEAGFADRNGDGVLDGPDGQPFRFKITYPSTRKNYETMSLFIKDALGRAGIVMDLDPLEWSVFQDRLENKNFDAISLGWSAGIETDVFQMFHSSLSMPGGDNFMSYKNAELDRLMETARSTIDEKARIPLWNRCHQILNEDQPYMFLWFAKELDFVDKRFENVRETRTGLTPSYEWFVPKAQQRWTR